MTSFQRELEQLHTAIVEQIVDSVWEKYSGNDAARYLIYDRIADSFAGMVRALRTEKDEKPLIQKIETEETDDEESSP